MGATVYTTAGGRRFHFDRACSALANGREFHALRAGVGALSGLYRLRTRSNTGAALEGLTACRVCVPPALALPATGETYEHERLTINPSCCGDDCCGGREEREVCVRCSNDLSRRHGWNWALAVPWPCTSAVVLGLVPRCPDCGWGVDEHDCRKCRSCQHDDQTDALGAAL
jgi:hypothetical protein